MKQDIIIKHLERGYDVWVGDKHTEQLSYDEMLGVIATLCFGPNIFRVHDRWFKTDDELRRERARMQVIAKEPLLIEDTSVSNY